MESHGTASKGSTPPDLAQGSSGNPGDGPSAGHGITSVPPVVFLVAAVHDQEGQPGVWHYDAKVGGSCLSSMSRPFMSMARILVALSQQLV